MPADDLKIGIIGGYVSGKATFLNALLKVPCFRMRSNTLASNFENFCIMEVESQKKK